MKGTIWWLGWPARHGALVLKYRLSREKDSTYFLEKDAVGDMQRAIRLVRSRAKEWSIDPSKVGARLLRGGRARLHGSDARRPGKFSRR